MFRHIVILLIPPFTGLVSHLTPDDRDREILALRQQVSDELFDLISPLPINPSSHVVDVVGRGETAPPTTGPPPCLFASDSIL